MFRFQLLTLILACLLLLWLASCGAGGNKPGLQQTTGTAAPTVEKAKSTGLTVDDTWKMYGFNGTNQRRAIATGPHDAGAPGIWYSDPIYTLFECTPVFDSYGTCYLEDIQGNVYTVDISSGVGVPQLAANINRLNDSFGSCAITENNENDLYWAADGYLFRKPHLGLAYTQHAINGSAVHYSSPVCPGEGTDLVVLASSFGPGSGDYLWAYIQSTMSPLQQIAMPGPSMSTPCCKASAHGPGGTGIYYPRAWMVCEDSGVHSVRCWDLNTAIEPWGHLLFSETPVDRCSITTGRCYTFLPTQQTLYAIETYATYMVFIDQYDVQTGETILSNLAYTYSELPGTSEVLFTQMDVNGQGRLAAFNSHGLSSGPAWLSDAFTCSTENPPAIDVDDYVYITSGSTFNGYTPFSLGHPTAPVLSLTLSEGSFKAPSIHDGRVFAVYEDPRGFSRLCAFGDGAGMTWPPVPPDNSDAWPQEGKVVAKHRRAAATVFGALGSATPYNVMTTGWKAADATISTTGAVYLSQGDGRLLKFDSATNTVAWTFTPGMLGTGRSTPALSPYGDKVYYTYWNVEGGRGNTWLSAVNTTTGAECWRVRLGHDEYYNSPAVGADDNIYIGGIELPPSGPCDCSVLVISPQGQLLAQTAPLAAESLGSCALDSVGNIYVEYMYYNNTTQLYKYRYDPILRVIQTLVAGPVLADTGSYASPPVLVNDAVLINTGFSALYVQDTSTLAVNHTRLPAYYYTQDNGPAIGSNGLAYLQEYTAASPWRFSITCYDPLTGTDLWTSAAVTGASFSRPLVVPSALGENVIFTSGTEAYIINTARPQPPRPLFIPGNFTQSSPTFGMLASGYSMLIPDQDGDLWIMPFI